MLEKIETSFSVFLGTRVSQSLVNTIKMEHLQEINLLSGLAIRRVKEMEGRIKELEAELKALKPRCLYEGYANARDYLEDVLDLPSYWELEKSFYADKKRVGVLVPVRCEPNNHGVAYTYKELETPIPPRADGRKIATASFERTYGCPINNWFKMDETPFLRNCPLYEGDVFLEELRAKHTDEELEDLFYSFQGWEKKTYTEAMKPPSPLEVAEAKLADAEQRAEKAEATVKRMKERPEIRGQSAMQMVIAISMIARSYPEADFNEVHDLWVAHTETDNPRDPLTCLCACLEPGCPTFEKVYKKERGFVSRWDLEENCDCCDGYSPGFVSGDEPCDKCLRRQEEEFAKE